MTCREANMVEPLTQQQTREWLRNHGVKNVQSVLDGIDWNQPVYLTWLDEGDRLVQYRDLPSVAYPEGALGGQWFALPSHPGHLGTLGIGSGAAGRRRVELRVVRAVRVLESTARKMDRPGAMPYERYRGSGGATQIFIPDGGLSSLG